jgi:hypothetical protein
MVIAIFGIGPVDIELADRRSGVRAIRWVGSNSDIAFTHNMIGDRPRSISVYDDGGGATSRAEVNPSPGTPG